LALAALKPTLSDHKLVTAFPQASTALLQMVAVAADQNKPMDEVALLVAAPDIMVVRSIPEELAAAAAMVAMAQAPVVVAVAALVALAQLDQPEMAAMVYHPILPALRPLTVVVVAAVIKDRELALAALAAAEPADVAPQRFHQPARMVMVVAVAVPVKRRMHREAKVAPVLLLLAIKILA
jgi:hypothetical protein